MEQKLNGKYLTPIQIEEEFGVIKAGTLANLRCQGRGPDFFKIGRNIYYTPQEVERWINSHHVKTSDSD